MRGEAQDAEIPQKGRAEPKDEAEEALWQAMGWNDAEGESGVDVAMRRMRDGLRGSGGK